MEKIRLNTFGLKNLCHFLTMPLKYSLRTVENTAKYTNGP
jgi:hypothetical protein